MVKDEVGLVDEKVHVRGADGIFWNSSDRSAQAIRQKLNQLNE